MKCILHIGTEKTGTTRLQSFLYQNRNELRRRGILLTNSFGRPNNRLLAAYFGTESDMFWKLHRLETEQKKESFYKGRFLKFNQEIEEATDCHSVIISSEHFHSRVTKKSQIDHLNQYLRQYFEEVQVICYFREQTDMGISSYSTSLKSFGTTYLEEYLERRLKPENYFFDFGKICENWSSAFGKNACLFRIFDRELLLGNDIRRDFLEVLDIQNDSFDFSDDQHANESLSQVHSILLRAINSKLDDWGDFSSRIALHKRLWSAFEKEVPKVGTISSNLRLEYFSRFEASNKLFFDKYISGTDAFSPPSVRAASAPSFLSEPEFLKIVEGIVNVTVDNVLSGPEKIQQLQAELKKSQAELKKTQAELKKTVKTLRSTYRYPWKHLRQFLTRE